MAVRLVTIQRRMEMEIERILSRDLAIDRVAVRVSGGTRECADIVCVVGQEHLHETIAAHVLYSMHQAFPHMGVSLFLRGFGEDWDAQETAWRLGYEGMGN